MCHNDTLEFSLNDIALFIEIKFAYTYTFLIQPNGVKLMYKSISKKIVSNLIKKEYINPEDSDSYEYCFEICISTFISISAMIIISFFLNLTIQSIIFIAVFILCRMCFGGYHAKTHKTCFLATLTNYFIFIYLLKSLELINSFFVFISLNLISVILVHALAPIENINNPLSDTHKKKLKHFSYIVTYSIFFISLFLFFFKFIPNHIAYSMLIGLLSAAIAMLLGQLELKLQKGGKKNEEKNIKSIDNNSYYGF